MPEVIDSMLANRRLERVAANSEHASQVIDTAERHLRTAAPLANTDDQAMAFTAAYDGSRKALTAVLAAEGLRARPIGGAHRNTGQADAAFVDDLALKDFDWMRQVRNATEYPSTDRPGATVEDVREAIEAASELVRACASYVRSRASG